LRRPPAPAFGSAEIVVAGFGPAARAIATARKKSSRYRAIPPAVAMVFSARAELGPIAPKRHGNVKDSDKHEALRKKGMSKERAAKISNAGKSAEEMGGRHSHKGSSD
jgi:hypothetical protein